MERAIERLIVDDIFLEYNFQGIKGKKSLCDLVLFDQVLYGKLSYFDLGTHSNSEKLKLTQ